MARKRKTIPFSSFMPDTTTRSPLRIMYLAGIFTWIAGEITILVQVISAAIGRVNLMEFFSASFWNFDTNISGVLFTLVPILLLSFAILPMIPGRKPQATFIVINVILLSASFYIGAGWYIGGILGLVGLWLVAMVPNMRSRRPPRVMKQRYYKYALASITCALIMAPVLVSYSLIQPTLAPYYFNPYQLYPGVNGPPNENNMMYILPIWEDTSSYTSNISYFKEELGNGSDYVKIGFSASCWYMGELNGAIDNWTFNPFSSLYYKLNFSVNYSIPVLFHMNGGNWGMEGWKNTNKSSIVTDLWADNDSNVQWDQNNNSVPASQAELELPLKPRLFTLSKYSQIYPYREQNVKIAGTILKDFMDAYPDLFVGCSMDSEIHLEHTNYHEFDDLVDDYDSYFDYNPLVIQEFQEWLQAKYSTISELNDKFNLAFASFGSVDPPRKAIKSNPWWEEWTDFRIFHVKQNVEAEASWLVDVGIPKNKIYSHQILSTPGSDKARYHRCDPLETADIENGTIGITRYGLIEPGVFKEINNRADFNWGIFEWNIGSRRDQSYENYMFMLKSMYQYGIKVICPYAWHEYLWSNLQISNNTAFKNAVHDFAVMVGDRPRATDYDGFLDLTDFAFGWFDNRKDYFDEYWYLLFIPMVIFHAIYWPLRITSKRALKRKARSSTKDTGR
ncbi:hypothetical protein GF325_16090 [Candidatus Bathyarchaeota archaeon]|nr:hypothetical protein [Candidatus Bathyarchaeota archaeon]